ncbi:hypothetical protein [Pseudogracilibacillus auburnensis]|nr:hypothetical protein [Pseudogracilibacillus auburnensis]MBO1003138.1 hypothetical protein [Pseudogracilibacillus auburnensis]
MIYVMSKEMYKTYTTGKGAINHWKLLEHINEAFGFRGEIKTIQVR